MTKLSDEEVLAQLADGGLPGWRFDRGEIFKTFTFETFMDAIGFIDRIAVKAEAADHHPDLENHYNRVRVAFHTWSESAVTEKDLALAREIESVASSR